MEIFILIFIVLYLTWRMAVNPELANSITVKQWLQFIGAALGALFVAGMIIVIGRSFILNLENRNLFSFLALCLIVFASWIAFRIIKKFTPIVVQKILGFYYER